MSENVAQPDDGVPDTLDRDEELSRDELFEVLGNDRRRYAVETILNHEGGLEITSLVDRVAALENDKPAEELTSAERKRVYTALQQTHLPKLEELGLIDWDRKTGDIEPAERLTNVNVYLGVVSGRRIPFSIVYLLLALVGAGIILVNWLGVAPIAPVPDSVMAGVVVGAFGITALAHFYRIRQTKLDPENFIPGGEIHDPEERRGLDVEPPPLSLSVVSGLVAGLLAGAGMGAVLHYVMFMMPLIGSLYGRPSVVWGLGFHMAHSLLLAIVFALAVSRTRLWIVGESITGATALGGFYGVALWIVAEGVLLPAVSDAGLRTLAVVSGYDVLYLPMDGLAAHVVFGMILGSAYVAGLGFFSR